jgi:RND family efflux transporter MFP subunit
MKPWILFFGILSFLACEGTEKQEVPKTPLPITCPIQCDTLLNREYVAEIQAIQNIELRARVKGFVDQVLVDEGQTVSQGQVLFRLSNPTLKEAWLGARARTKSAEATWKSANIEWTNIRNLLEKGVVSSAQLDLARSTEAAREAELDEARSQEAQAALEMTFAEIKAPFSGRINRLPYKKGSLVNEGDLLTTLSDTREVFAYFHVSEQDFTNYMVHIRKSQPQRVSLVMANGQQFASEGEIETVEGEIDRGTGSIAFRARFKNPEGLLRHGASGKVKWPEHIQNALIAPQKSVFEIQDKNWVYIWSKGKGIRMQEVKIAKRLPSSYVLSSGLGIRDTLLFEGHQNVQEGEIREGQFKPLVLWMNRQNPNP